MTQNHHQQPPLTSATTPTTTAAMCAICNTDDHWILHNHIESRTTNHKKICTCCFLKLYPTSFCPTCFNLHDCNSLTPPPLMASSNSRFLTCLKCSSISHLTCVPVNAPKSPYLCPPCSNPNFSFFNFKKPKIFDSAAVDGGDGAVGDGGDGGGGELKKVMDERGARVLLLAAKMSVIVMNKAAGAARSEAERKVKEAALARKRAKESIDHVMMLSSKLINVKQHRSGGVVNSSPVPPVKVESNGNVVNGGNVGNGNGNGSVAVVVVAPSNGGTENKAG